MATHGRYWDSWINRDGPGDSRPTALQIIKDEELEGGLRDKTVVITGASAGLGVETVRALHATGAKIFAIGRNEARLGEAIKDVQISAPGNEAPIIPIIIDQESLESVRRGAQEILEKSGKINILINNAGIMATPKGRTNDGFERQFGVNHLSHFLLFQILKPALLAASTPEFNSRVVMVSSRGHHYGTVRLTDYAFDKSPYDPFLSYGQSKTANIWMANEIERLYGSKGLHGLSLTPGFIRTGLMQYLEPSIVSTLDNPLLRRYEKNVEQGAATSVYAAVSRDLEGEGAIWLANCERWHLGEHKPAEDDGHSLYAFNPEGEKQLWKDSLNFVGLASNE